MKQDLFTRALRIAERTVKGYRVQIMRLRPRLRGANGRGKGADGGQRRRVLLGRHDGHGVLGVTARLPFCDPHGSDARIPGLFPRAVPKPGQRGERVSARLWRKTLASGIFSSIHVNHLYGVWLGPWNECIVVQQQGRLDYPKELYMRSSHREFAV